MSNASIKSYNRLERWCVPVAGEARKREKAFAYPVSLKKMNAVCVFADALQPGRTSTPVIAPSSLNFLLRDYTFFKKNLSNPAKN